MKKGLSLLLVVCVTVLAFISLTACDDRPTGDTPQKLSTPVVTLTENVASWEADSNADKFEISLDGSLSYVENTVTSKTLTDGQTLKVRAVGDGTAYATSDWSNSVTFTQGTPSPSQTKLGTPTVTISNTGLASWAAVTNASSYAYKISGGAETPTTATSVQLTDGQSIVVKAVGDGTNYTDSDYSASKTYTTGTPTPTQAPAYLGIFASGNEPSSTDGLPGAFATRPMTSRIMPRGNYSMTRGGSYRVFGTALDEYFENSDNHLNANFPTASDYGVYARAGETVYVQIWLNNPSQHTILSLELNGTKYQVGGGLSSFFIEEGGQYYNCVYVAVTVPNGSHDTISYQVTKIEYVEGTNINQDGKAVLIDEEKDTVTIGLPYQAQTPTVSDFNLASPTINGCSATFNLTDANGLIGLSDGWLGVAVYDGQNIVANKAVVSGSNSVSATGLVENTTYWVTVYLYADLHDGNGVSAHVLYEQMLRTPQAITVNEMSGVLLYDSAKDGYYGALRVKTVLNSPSAQYIKLEILNDQEQVVYTDTTFNGTATVSDGILCGSSYTVRVYYKDTEYPEGKYAEEYAWISYLGTPWYQNEGAYTFVNDAVFHFQLNNNDENYPVIQGFTLKFYNKDTSRWVASDVLYVLNNPTAIDTLNAQIDTLREEFQRAEYGSAEQMEIHNRMSELEEQVRVLEHAVWYLENRADNNRDKAYWTAEAAKGKYFYTFTYNGTDTQDLFKIGKTYYVVLDDVFCGETDNFDVEINYQYDPRDGSGVTLDTMNVSANLDRALTQHWVLMENLTYADGSITLTLYNEPDWGETTRPPFAIGYVWKVMVGNDVLYLDDSTHATGINEQAWFNAYITRVKAGQSVDGLMEEFVPDYASSYTIPLDTTKLQPGYHLFYVYLRLIATDYEEDGYHADRTQHLEIHVKPPKPSITFGSEGQVVTGLDNWYGSCAYEAYDQNNNPVTIKHWGELTSDQQFDLPPAGARVRVKLLASDHWLESEWSEWYTFDGIKLPAPVLGDYATDTCKIGWSMDDATNVSHYVYTINGGTEVRVELNGLLAVVLDHGDVFRVKAVPTDEATAGGYLGSEWATYTCTDTRTALATPSNVKMDGAFLTWDAVDGASRYVVEITLEGGRTMEREVGKTSYGAPSYATAFRVRAMTDDTENYKPSAWSASVVNTSEK